MSVVSVDTFVVGLPTGGVVCFRALVRALERTGFVEGNTMFTVYPEPAGPVEISVDGHTIRVSDQVVDGDAGLHVTVHRTNPESDGEGGGLCVVRMDVFDVAPRAATDVIVDCVTRTPAYLLAGDETLSERVRERHRKIEELVVTANTELGSRERFYLNTEWAEVKLLDGPVSDIEWRSSGFAVRYWSPATLTNGEPSGSSELTETAGFGTAVEALEWGRAHANPNY